MKFKARTNHGRFYYADAGLHSLMNNDPTKEAVVRLLEQRKIKPSSTTVCSVSGKKVKDHIATLSASQQTNDYNYLNAFEEVVKSHRAVVNKELKEVNSTVKVELTSLEALEIGRVFHDYIECAFGDKAFIETNALLKFDQMERLQKYIKAFDQMNLDYQISAIMLEETLEADMFTATLDFFGRYDSVKEIVDWKSGKALDVRKTFLQIAAQEAALHDNEVESIGVAHFRSDGSYKKISIIGQDKEVTGKVFSLYNDAFYANLGIDVVELKNNK